MDPEFRGDFGVGIPDWFYKVYQGAGGVESDGLKGHGGGRMIQKSENREGDAGACGF